MGRDTERDLTIAGSLPDAFSDSVGPSQSQEGLYPAGLQRSQELGRKQGPVPTLL